jgi:hypothetical protein
MEATRYMGASMLFANVSGVAFVRRLLSRTSELHATLEPGNIDDALRIDTAILRHLEAKILKTAPDAPAL